MIGCPADEADAAATAEDHEPFPNWVLDRGEVVPDDFSLAISPPTGSYTLAQSFDLMLMAVTGGASITTLTGTIDGQDVSGPLNACMAPAGSLRGVTGSILACRGLSGRRTWCRPPTSRICSRARGRGRSRGVKSSASSKNSQARQTAAGARDSTVSRSMRRTVTCWGSS